MSCWLSRRFFARTAHSAGATELCGRDDEVEQGDQNSRHTRASVGHTVGGAQRCSSPGFTRESGIRDAHVRVDHGRYIMDVTILLPCYPLWSRRTDGAKATRARRAASTARARHGGGGRVRVGPRTVTTQRKRRLLQRGLESALARRVGSFT